MHRARHPRIETEPRAGVDKMILFSHCHMRGFGLYPIFKRGFLKLENGLVVAVGNGWGGGEGGGGVGEVLEILKPAAAL